MRRAYLTVIGVLAACILLPATAQAANVAVLGNNQTDEALVAAGHTVTLVTDAEVATPGFLDGFDVFIFTRAGGAFNATLSAGAAAQTRAFARRAVLLNGDFADSVGTNQEIRDLYVSSVLWAAENGGGYIGELEGATAGLSSNGDGQPALNLIAGAAGASQFSGNSSTINVTDAGLGHPVLQNVALPHTDEDIEFAALVSGAAAATVLARYAQNDNPAILAAELTNVAVLGNNASDEELNEAPGVIATLVTDAQVATAGFLDDFDAFLFTRPGGAFNATLSAGAAAQVRAFARRAVLLNGDFSDAVGADQEIHDLYVSSVLWAAANGGGYIGELEGATAGLSANGDGQPALNFIAGTAGASQFTGNSSTLNITAAGSGHPVLDNVTLPHTNEDIEFAALVTGAADPTVLARYAQNDNPAILAAEVKQVAVLGNNATDDELNEAPGIVATLVTDAQVATAGFLDDFDAFIFTRPGGAFNATLSAGAAAQVRAFARRAVLLNGDFADAVGADQEIHDLYVSSVLWAAENGGGYIGELEGATAGLGANGDGQPALNLIAGTAGASQFTGNSSTLNITAAGSGHPVLDNVTLPHTNEDIEFAALVSGAAAATVLARYAQNDNPAILAAELTNVAVLGNNATDDELNEAPGIVATLVTDAQVATAGFLDDFDAFIFTRPGGAFNATLSAAAAARVVAFTNRAVLLNGDFADAVGADQEIHDLYVSSVLWAAANGGGYIGELEGATAGLSANGDGQPALNFIAGTAGASQFTGNSSTLTVTAAGSGHPVLDNVTLPHTNEDIEFAALVSGAEPATVLARYANGNPAILATAGANRPPVATDAAVSVPEDGSVSIVLAGTDPDGDPLTITVTTPPAHGIVRQRRLHARTELPRPGLDRVHGRRRQGRHRHGDDLDHGDIGERSARLLAGRVLGACERAAHRNTGLHRRRRRDAQLRGRQRPQPRHARPTAGRRLHLHAPPGVFRAGQLHLPCRRRRRRQRQRPGDDHRRAAPGPERPHLRRHRHRQRRRRQGLHRVHAPRHRPRARIRRGAPVDERQHARSGFPLRDDRPGRGPRNQDHRRPRRRHRAARHRRQRQRGHLPAHLRRDRAPRRVPARPEDPGHPTRPTLRQLPERHRPRASKDPRQGERHLLQARTARARRPRHLRHRLRDDERSQQSRRRHRRQQGRNRHRHLPRRLRLGTRVSAYGHPVGRTRYPHGQLWWPAT